MRRPSSHAALSWGTREDKARSCDVGGVRPGRGVRGQLVGDELQGKMEGRHDSDYCYEVENARGGHPHVPHVLGTLHTALSRSSTIDRHSALQLSRRMPFPLPYDPCFALRTVAHWDLHASISQPRPSYCIQSAFSIAPLFIHLFPHPSHHKHNPPHQDNACCDLQVVSRASSNVNNPQTRNMLT